MNRLNRHLLWLVLFSLVGLSACAPMPEDNLLPAEKVQRPVIKGQKAFFEDTELVEILAKMHYESPQIIKPGVVVYGAGPSTLVLRNLPSGELRQAFYGENATCKEWIFNDWNRDHLHSRAFLAKDGTPVLASEQMAAGGLNRATVEVFINLFAHSVSEYRTFLRDKCTAK